MKPAAYLVMTNISPTDWSSPIDPGRHLIGRSPEASIRIPDRYPHVAGRHAEFWADDRHIVLCDLESRAGTKVNGVWLRAECPIDIAVGDRIWLGGVEVVVVDRLARPVRSKGNGANGRRPSTGGDSQTVCACGAARTLLKRLSPAELDVLLWMGRGTITDSELGRALHRSPHTVRTQIASIFEKLDIHSRSELLSWLQRTNHSHPPPPTARFRKATSDLSGISGGQDARR